MYINNQKKPERGISKAQVINKGHRSERWGGPSQQVGGHSRQSGENPCSPPPQTEPSPAPPSEQGQRNQQWAGRCLTSLPPYPGVWVLHPGDWQRDGAWTNTPRLSKGGLWDGASQSWVTAELGVTGGPGFTRWESGGALGGLSPRRMGHLGEEVTGAGRRKWREMVVSGGPRAGQAGGCRVWGAWQGLRGHRDAGGGRGHWVWEILAKVAGSGVTEPGDADESGGAGVAGPEYGQYLEV